MQSRHQRGSSGSAIYQFVKASPEDVVAMESPDVPVSLWYVGQVNVVVPHTPETGQDLSEGRHYQVLPMPQIEMIRP